MLDDQTENTSPALSLVPKGVDSRKSQIKNFAQWICTWNTFMSVFLHFRPEFVSQLHGYQDSISQLAAPYLANYWLTYDAQFGKSARTILSYIGTWRILPYSSRTSGLRPC